MKIFLIVVGCGVSLVLFSMLWSSIAEMASQRSDFGIVAGSLLAIVVIAGLVALIPRLVKTVQGADKPKEKP